MNYTNNDANFTINNQDKNKYENKYENFEPKNYMIECEEYISENKCYPLYQPKLLYNLDYVSLYKLENNELINDNSAMSDSCMSDDSMYSDSSESIYTNHSNIYKNKINCEFRNYIINNFNNKCIYNKSKERISFKLSKISNITNIISKIENDDKTNNKKHNKTNNKIQNKTHNKKLEYKMHQYNLIDLIDKIMILMSNKNYYFNFNAFDYQLYELENDISIDKIYFIKIKIKHNLCKKSTLLFHKDIILEYMHI